MAQTFDRLDDTSQRLLDDYYQLWVEGKETPAIVAALKTSEKRLKSLMPYLLAHCRHKLKHETRKSLTQGQLPDSMRLTPERRAEFLDHVANGASYDKAALVMGLPLPTLTEVWFVEDPSLIVEAQYQRDLQDLRVVKSLFRRAQDREVCTQTVTETEADDTDEFGKVRRDSDGNALKKRTKSTTKTSKYVEGCFNAQRFLLTNRMPEQWSLDGLGNSGGSKGKILAALESYINERKDTGEDAKFDAESPV